MNTEFENMRFFICSLLLVAVSGIPFKEKARSAQDEPQKLSFKETIEKLEKLMVEVLNNEHESEEGFVKHEEIEKPGGEIIDLIIKAIKPVGKIVRLTLKDFEICERKLENAFKSGKSDREIALQAGQCFFVIHRPFVVLLRQVLEKGLIDKMGDNGQKREKRNMEPLIKKLKGINERLERFKVNRPDLVYVIKILSVIHEYSEFLKDAKSLGETVVRDYIELVNVLLEHIHKGDTKGAQLIAGCVYLSYSRKILKVKALLKHFSGKGGEGEHHGEGPSGGNHEFTKYPTGGPNTGRPCTVGLCTGRPNTGGPNTGRPNTGGPNTGRPNTGRPNTGRPNTGRPNTGRPNTGGPYTGGHKFTTKFTKGRHTQEPTSGMPADSNDLEDFNFNLFDLKNE